MYLGSFQFSTIRNNNLRLFFCFMFICSYFSNIFDGLIPQVNGYTLNLMGKAKLPSEATQAVKRLLVPPGSHS